jgi:hypothetical protein
MAVALWLISRPLWSPEKQQRSCRPRIAGGEPDPKRLIRLRVLVPREGIEPPTRCLEGNCSIRLSYRGRRII